jgi:hypothetical protein
MFRGRPRTYSNTDLGHVGTQSSQMISNEFGHFTVDAKRGQVFQLGGGDKLSLREISSDAENRGVDMRDWFKEHLPFKILKSKIEGLEDIDTDNPYNGIGISMGWDSRFRRVFITKKDYIPKIDTIKYIDGEGYFDTEGGTSPTITCPEGYEYNPSTTKCELIRISEPICPPGYTYNKVTNECTLSEITLAICECLADVFGNNQTVASGSTNTFPLTSSVAGITYSWVASTTSVIGATSGAGLNLTQTLYNYTNVNQIVTYTVTPYEIINGCEGAPITIVITVTPPSALPDLCINFEVSSVYTTTTTLAPTTTTTLAPTTTTVAPVAECLNNFTIETIYISQVADLPLLPIGYEHPCPATIGDHTCNRALHEVYGNGVYVGDSKMNNYNGALSGTQTAYGTYICGDYLNFPHALVGGTWTGNTRARYSKIVLDAAQAVAIAAVTGGTEVTFALEAAMTTYNTSCQARSDAHTDVTWVRLTDGDGVVYYNGCPGGNFVTIDVCNPNNGTTTAAPAG